MNSQQIPDKPEYGKTPVREEPNVWNYLQTDRWYHISTASTLSNDRTAYEAGARATFYYDDTIMSFPAIGVDVQVHDLSDLIPPQVGHPALPPTINPSKILVKSYLDHGFDSSTRITHHFLWQAVDLNKQLSRSTYPLLCTILLLCNRW